MYETGKTYTSSTSAWRTVKKTKTTETIYDENGAVVKTIVTETEELAPYVSPTWTITN